jgi:hypothetical protein
LLYLRTPLKKHLPLELATRSLALYNLKNGKTCSSYFGAIPTIGGGASQHCGSWNFTDVDQLKLFVNGTWYGDEYKPTV